MSLTLRLAVPGDWRVISMLVPELVAFGPPPWRDAGTMTRTDLAVIEEATTRTSQCGDVAVYVAELGSEVVAFVHVRAVTDYYLRAPQAHVADLVVSPRARGQGIAGKLLVQAELWARENGFIQLTIAVFEENVDALALYVRRGFRRETIRLIKPL